MQNSPELSQAYNDEFEIAELVRAVWQGKWLVIGTALTTLALGIAYIMLAPKSYTGSLEISPLPLDKVTVYSELYESKIIPNYSVDISDEGGLLNTKDWLMTLFVKDLQAKVGDVFDQASLANISANPSIMTLSFPTQAPDQLRQTLADFLESTNQNVKQQLVRGFLIHSSKLDYETSLAIASLDLEQQLLFAAFEARKTEKLAYLNEHAQLARLIDLDIGPFANLANFETNYKFNFVDTKKNPEANTLALQDKLKSSIATQIPYVRGFIVLEKEIELIESRAVESFIPDLVRIKLLKSEILKKKKLKRAKLLLESTPIGTDQFVAVDYNLDSLVYKNNTPTRLILGLSIILGGIFGVFVLFMRNALVKKD